MIILENCHISCLQETMLNTQLYYVHICIYYEIMYVIHWLTMRLINNDLMSRREEVTTRLCSYYYVLSALTYGTLSRSACFLSGLCYMRLPKAANKQLQKIHEQNLPWNIIAHHFKASVSEPAGNCGLKPRNLIK